MKQHYAVSLAIAGAGLFIAVFLLAWDDPAIKILGWVILAAAAGLAVITIGRDMKQPR